MEITLVLVLLAAAVALFVSEKLPATVVSMLMFCVVVVTGLLGAHFGFIDPAKWVGVNQAMDAFRSPAVIAVACMFVLSAALEKAGVVDRMVHLLSFGAANPTLLLACMMTLAAAISAFVNNTAAVAALLPAMVALCAKRGYASSRFLIPMSYASQFGGVCTLIGTSTNLLVNDVAMNAGVRGFGFFEFLPAGLCMVAVGMAFILIAGRFLLPDRGVQSKADENRFTVDVTLRADAPMLGRAADTVAWVPKADGHARALSVRRDGERLAPAGCVLRAGDRVLLEADVRAVDALCHRQGLAFPAGTPPAPDGALKDDPLSVVRVMAVPARGSLLRPHSAHSAYADAVPVGIHRSAPNLGPVFDDELPPGPGDLLLLLTRARGLAALRARRDLILLEHRMPVRRSTPVMIAVSLTFVGVVLGSLFTGAPIALCALIGAVALVASGCLKLEEAVRAVDWKVLLLLIGLLPLGMCMEKSGAAAALAEQVVRGIGSFGPLAMLAAIYLITGVLTEFMSNNATAVLLTPVAITAAHKLGVQPQAFIVAVAFAASTSFATPVGYQTNAMVYAPGGYKFSDFLRAGVPLNLLFWAAAVLVIPLFWPF